MSLSVKKITFATAWINTFTKCYMDPLEHCDVLADTFGQTMERFGPKWAIKLDEKTAKPADWIARNAPKAFDTICPDKGDDMAPGHGIDTVDFAMIASHGSTWDATKTRRPIAPV